MKPQGLTRIGDYYADIQAANKKMGYSQTPEGPVWHRHQDRTTMQLVPKGVHRGTPHTSRAKG